MVLIGESCAFLAAISFVSSSTLFSSVVKQCTPLLLNMLKGLVSIFLSLITLYLFYEKVFPEASFQNYFLLILSGILGIAFGDTFYFIALDNIGARETILLETLAPTFTGILSFIYFGTTLSLLGWTGMILTCIGIYIVVIEKENSKQHTIEDLESGIELVEINSTVQTPLHTQSSICQEQEKFNQQQNQQDLQQNKKKKVIGMLCGAGFAICEAFGMILSFDGMRSGSFQSFQSVLIRMLAGTGGVALIFALKKGEKLQSPCKTKKEYVIFFIASTLNCYIGVWAQQMSITYTIPEIAQTIMGTIPLFSLAISWYQGEQMKLKYLIGSLIAVFGVTLIVWA